jgi:hypothetical protein
VSNRRLDNLLMQEAQRDMVACCECGYHRYGAAHPKVQCPATGRCGECGNDWPCDDHKLNHMGRRTQLNFDTAERIYSNLNRGRETGRLDWCEEALAAVREIAIRQDTFTTDDVWEMVGAPPEPRNMGNVMRKARNEGYCEPTDRVLRCKNKSRGTMLTVWRSAL